MRRPLNLGIIDHRDRLPYWLEKLRGGPLGVDTETTGFNWKRDRVGGLCLAARETAVYVYGNALGPSIEWLADQIKGERQLVFHHGKYDMHMMRGTFGLRISYPVHDTMIESFLLDNRGAPFANGTYAKKYGRHGLKELAAVFVDPQAHEPENELRDAVIAAGGRRGKDELRGWKSDILLAPPKIVGTYGALDAWYTLQLHFQFIERIKYWQQPDDDDFEYPSLMSLYETERWLLLALRDMEETGIRVNPVFFEEWKADLERNRHRCEKNLTKLSGGRSINWGSQPQLRNLMYEEMGLEPTRLTKGGKKHGPQPATDEVALLDQKHPFAAEMLRWRDIDKQLNTYARGLLVASDAYGDGRIHCRFKQTGARTGRLSCEDPNLQQVPRESGARRGFIPDDGLELRFADYSQVEMRFAAHFANDPTLVHGFIHDPNFDTHQATAKKMWGIHKPTKKQRKFAKIMNFAMLFGAGEDKVTSQLISMLSFKEARHAVHELGHKIAPGESPHRSLAQLLRKIYFKEFPAVKGAKYASQEATRYQGFAMNVAGRHRYLDESEVYKAFNSQIQGSAADQAKLGLVKIYRELQLNERSVKLMLQIHDEAVYLSDGDPRTDRKVLELLSDLSSFRVPIIADVSGSKKTWQDKEDLKLGKAA